MYDLVAVTQ